MKKQDHLYTLFITWTGNQGVGTKNYTSYARDHTVQVLNKPMLHASSDPMFKGDPSKYNPEELFVASLSSCHMLWYLHLCAENDIVIEAYEDKATGVLSFHEDDSGQFTEVTLHPTVKIKDGSKIELAEQLHTEANAKCFIAKSCNFNVSHQSSIQVVNH